jgi:ATP-dependent helicase YprA (DUF1998 family)
MQVKSTQTRQKCHSSGGNPDLEKYQFTTDRDEPLTAKFTLRVTRSMLNELQAISNWQEKTREKLSDLLREVKR